MPPERLVKLMFTMIIAPMAIGMLVFLRPVGDEMADADAWFNVYIGWSFLLVGWERGVAFWTYTLQHFRVPDDKVPLRWPRCMIAHVVMSLLSGRMMDLLGISLAVWLPAHVVVVLATWWLWDRGRRASNTVGEV